jgi:hypothetical protein
MGETWSDMSEEQHNGWSLHDWVEDWETQGADESL